MIVALISVIQLAVNRDLSQPSTILVSEARVVDTSVAYADPRSLTDGQSEHRLGFRSIVSVRIIEHEIEF